MNAPSMIAPTWMPMSVTTGIRAFLSAWRVMTLRARGPHVLEPEHVEQARADLPEVHGEARGRERDRRKHEPTEVVANILRERHVPARREDVSRDHVREEQDQHDPQEEAREGNA